MTVSSGCQFKYIYIALGNVLFSNHVYFSSFLRNFGQCFPDLLPLLLPLAAACCFGRPGVAGIALHYYILLWKVLLYITLFYCGRYCSTLLYFTVSVIALHYSILLWQVLLYTTLFYCGRYCSTLLYFTVAGIALHYSILLSQVLL